MTSALKTMICARIAALPCRAWPLGSWIVRTVWQGFARG